MIMHNIEFLLVFVFICIKSYDCKYMEGVLKTTENWAFLARFCFLSEEGQFEYEIEYNENQGDPNLLLYYDAEDQWPAAYKSNKGPGGMFFLPRDRITSTPIPRYTISIPTLPTRKIDIEKGLTSRITDVPTAMESSTTEYSTTSFSTTFTETETSRNEFFTTRNVMEGSYSTSYSEYDSFTDTTMTSFAEVEDSRRPPIKKRSVPIRSVNREDARSGKTVSCHNARRFRSSRERWWFIAVSNCKGTRGIDIKYKLLMTNGPPGDYWHEHFSADEFYILPVLMAFSIAYSFLILGMVMCSIELKSRQLLHTTYKIFVLSAVLQFFGILFQSICYLKYAVNGVPAVKCKRIGAILMGGSEACFLLLLPLLAKGFTVTRGRLPLAASIKLTVFMCVFVVTYIAIFIYEAQVFDPGEVLYLYESPAGYGLISLRVAAWCMFIYGTIFTLKRYPEKGNFYYPFNIFGTVWFVAGPAFILSANTYIDKWVRESVVCAVLLFITFGGHLMFLILTMPSVANKNFPYHVRTSQIGIMETMGNTGTSTMEQFGHHVYEPTTTIREQTVIIPLTKRTEELFEGMHNQKALQRNAIVNGHVDEPPELIIDPAIENVLRWSMAKNVPLELPDLERMFNRASTTSSNSRMSNGSSENRGSGVTTLRGISNKAFEGTYEEYAKDVPVELFTVSRMVVGKSKPVQNDTESD